MALKRLAGQVAVYTMANVATKASLFLIAPIIGKISSGDSVGKWGVLASLLPLFTYVIDFSISKGAARFYFDAEYHPGSAAQISIFNRIRYLSAAIIAPLLTVIGILAWPLLTGGIVPTLSIAGLVVYALSEAATMYATAILRAEGMAGQVLIARTAQALVTLIGALLGAAAWGALGALAGVTLGAVTGAAFGALFIARIYKAKLAQGRHADKLSDPGAASMIRFCAPLTLQDLAGWARNSSAPVLLATVAPTAVVGSYFLGAIGGGLLSLLVWSADVAIAPMYYQHRAKGLPVSDINAPYRLFSIALFGIAIFGILFCGPVITAIFPHQAMIASRVAPITIFASSFSIIYSVWVKALFYSKRTGSLAAGTLTISVLGLLLTLLLIRHYGYMAAAWTTVGVFAAMSAYAYIFARRLEPETTELLAPLGLVCLASVALTFVLLSNISGALGHIFASVLVFCVLATILSLLAYRTVKETRRS